MDYCEWCSKRVKILTFKEYDQELLNYVFDAFNDAEARGDDSEQNEIWQQHARGAEWPKVGDKRGFWCSSKCSRYAVKNGDYGSWHKRGWFW